MYADLQLTRFGEVRLENWAGEEDVYDPKIVTSLTLGYDISKNILINVGANNLFNVYPDEHDPINTESGGLWDAVQMGSGGAYYFTRVSAKF